MCPQGGARLVSRERVPRLVRFQITPSAVVCTTGSFDKKAVVAVPPRYLVDVDVNTKRAITSGGRNLLEANRAERHLGRVQDTHLGSDARTMKP